MLRAGYAAEELQCILIRLRRSFRDGRTLLTSNTSRQQPSDSGGNNSGLLSRLEKPLVEAFLSHVGFAIHMARFPEAERRRLHKMICMSILTRSPTLGLEDQLLLTFGRG